MWDKVEERWDFSKWLLDQPIYGMKEANEYFSSLPRDTDEDCYRSWVNTYPRRLRSPITEYTLAEWQDINDCITVSECTRPLNIRSWCAAMLWTMIPHDLPYPARVARFIHVWRYSVLSWLDSLPPPAPAPEFRDAIQDSGHTCWEEQEMDDYTAAMTFLGEDLKVVGIDVQKDSGCQVCRAQWPLKSLGQTLPMEEQGILTAVQKRIRGDEIVVINEEAVAVEGQSTEAGQIQQLFSVFSSVPHNFPTEALAFMSPKNWIDARASAIHNNITAAGRLSSCELPLGLIYWFLHSQSVNPEYINLFKEIDSSTANILMIKYLVWQPTIMKWLEDLHQNTLQLDKIHDMIRLDVLTICAQMLVITQNTQTCHDFLHQPPQDAQDSLNLLSQLLDFDGLSVQVRRHFTKVLTRLSSTSTLYPECLTVRPLDPGRWVDGGGFADVYRGFLSAGQVVSIKRPRIPLWQMEEFLKSWSREIILWSQLSHPNILPLYGIYYLDDPHGSPVCMISPWMDHGNIVQFLKSPPEHINRLALIQDISCGIQYLHHNSIIHGDLKGANILVTAMHRACIADFGLSDIATSQFPIMSSSKSSNQGGTMPWQAPETLRYPNPTRNTRQSDMYAFACVCCEVFTGKPPFCETENLRELLIRNMVLDGQRPKRPASSELTNALWDCILDCWKHDPDERPTAEEMIQRLNAMPELYGLDRPNSDTEWDKSAFTRRFRSSMRDNPLLPSVEQLQMILPGARRSSTPVFTVLGTGRIDELPDLASSGSDLRSVDSHNRSQGNQRKRNTVDMDSEESTIPLKRTRLDC
ncbi:kinase-like domain-containing protein [Mycena floridula]|nr:kinase-like domain-containing protein [Mycena floridula]